METTWTNARDIRGNLARFWALLRDAGLAWVNDSAFRYGAALSFYTVVSLAPLVVMILSLATLLFGEQAARNYLLEQFNELIGPEGAEVIRTIVDRARQAGGGTLATVFGIVAFLVAFLGVLMELQAALNHMWHVQVKPQTGAILAAARKYVVSYALLAAIGFLLIVSLVVSATLVSLYEWLARWQPELALLWQVGYFVLSAVVFVFLFGLMFKFVPDVKIAWKDVWVGAVITTILFVVGKVLIGLYLGTSGVSSAYGAAGSLIVLLLWLYYSTLIVFYGAELTRVYANRYGSQIRPSKHAMPEK